MTVGMLWAIVCTTHQKMNFKYNDKEILLIIKLCLVLFFNILHVKFFSKI
jgi:hypothetical protein